MRVSCVIPTRDRCRMVCAAIDSVVRQQWPGLEIVVVDDGSSDGTAEMVAARYPAVRLVRLAGLGAGPARNAGVAAARGEVVMFLDSDDLWLDRHVAVLVATLERGFEVAYGTTETIDQVSRGRFCIPEPGQGREGAVLAGLLRWCFLVPSALAVRRRAFDVCGGFGTEPFGEDWSLLLRLASRYPFGFAGARPISRRHLHRGSLCCLTGRELLVDCLSRLGEEVAVAVWGGVETAQRFVMLAQWVRDQNETSWTTVQEWYCAMREEGLV